MRVENGVIFLCYGYNAYQAFVVYRRIHDAKCAYACIDVFDNTIHSTSTPLYTRRLVQCDVVGSHITQPLPLPLCKG